MAPNQALERAVTTASQLHEASVPVAQRRALGIRPGEQKRLDKGVKKAGSRHNTNGLNGQRLKLYA